MRSPLAVQVLLLALLGGCGGEEQVGSRELAIVNGVDDPGHPAVGLLLLPKGRCTGTLVGSRSVLTAAHCALTSGSYRFQIGGKVIKAQKVTAHAEFKGEVAVPGLPNTPWFSVADVAVILLEEEVIGIAPVRISTREPQKGQPITLVGFGVTGANDKTPPKKRRTENVIGNLGPEYILYGSWGGLEGGPGQTCSGDSGGPTLVTEDGEERLLAVTSFGDVPECVQWTFSARADYYREWIKSHADGNLGVLGDRTAPAVAIDSPVPDAKVPPSFPVRVISQDDGAGIASVALFVDGREVARSEQPNTELLVTALAAGKHELAVRATDRSGNTSDTRISVQVVGEKADDPAASAQPEESSIGGCSLARGRVASGGGWILALLAAFAVRRRRW